MHTAMNVWTSAINLFCKHAMTGLKDTVEMA